VVVPYWKYTVVLNPCGSSVPLSLAEEVVTFVAGFVLTTGNPVMGSVVKVVSLPNLVPAVLLATIRK
jgi:hypothetical protein